MATKQLGPAASGPSDVIKKSELDAATGGSGLTQAQVLARTSMRV